MRTLGSICRPAAALAGLALLTSLLVGCPRRQAVDENAAGRLPLEGVKLRLLVVDDPAMAAAIGKVRGEWHSQTGATLEVAQTTEEELLAAEKPAADAAICASYLLGELAQRRRLAEIPAALRAEGREEWADIFELARAHEVAWGSKTLAVPFGSPVLVCYYRADMLAALGKSPPETWADYQELAAQLADRDRLGPLAPPSEAAWSGTMEPLGPGWGGLVLLARASSGVEHPSNYSTWFDIETMAPLIDGPPVIRALVQLVETAKHGASDQLEADPEKVREAFWQGKCGMALTWPTAAAPSGVETSTTERPAAGVAELPGSREHFDVDHGRWEKRDRRENAHVPLLATSGRIGVVFCDAPMPAAAELLTWLSALQSDPPPAARSPWTTLFRKSQMARPADWVEPAMSPATAADYARQTKASFESERWTFALRIPGRRRYLAALDEAVAAAVRGEKAPAAALAEAAGKWRAITRELGPEQQRAAYLRSIELEP
ncbi:MAG: extracellular solute-binding protein [Pirellulales bacterium]|nr:extracellular solute-binding protein [Pirellulales bacterium]